MSLGTRSVFIASPEGDTGKSTVALGVLDTLVRETERVGVLRIATTRGDRLFISLLGAAFIHLAWLGLFGPDQLWWAFGLSLVYAAGVFRFV